MREIPPKEGTTYPYWAINKLAKKLKVHTAVIIDALVNEDPEILDQFKEVIKEGK